MNKKLILLILLMGLLLVIPAQAGLIDWFMGLFGLTSPEQVTNYVNQNGFELYTDKMEYNCFRNNNGIVKSCQPIFFNISTQDITTINTTSMFPSDVNILKIYEGKRDIDLINGTEYFYWKEVNVDKYTEGAKANGKFHNYKLKKGTNEFKLEFLPANPNGKFDIKLDTINGEVLLDPFYNASNGFYNAVTDPRSIYIYINATTGLKEFVTCGTGGTTRYDNLGILKGSNVGGLYCGGNVSTIISLNSGDMYNYQNVSKGTIARLLSLAPNGLTQNSSGWWYGVSNPSNMVYLFSPDFSNNPVNYSLAVDNGQAQGITNNNINFFVTESNAPINQTIFVYDRNFNVVRTYGYESLTGGAGLAGLAYDSLNQSLWASDNTDRFIYHLEDNSSTTPANITINSRVYDVEIFQDFLTTFIINYTLNETNNLNYIKFYYNGISYTPTTTNSSINYLSTYSLITQNGGNIPFYWFINTTKQSLNDTLLSQNVLNITFEFTGVNCSAGLYQSMYFNFKDEQNLSNINVSIDYNFKYGITNNTIIQTFGKIVNTNHLYLCINSTLYNNYSVGYGEIQYQGDGYVKRRFYVFNGQRISNITLSNTLYDLLNPDATSFLLTVKDTALTPYVNKYVGLLRWYPNLNAYYTVDMGLTDDKGQTVIRVKTEDVDYRLALYEQNGSLIKLFNPIRMVCLSSPCEYSAVVIKQGSDMTIWEKIEQGLTYNPTTKIFTFAWNDPSQLTQSMRLLVQKERGDYMTTICDTSSSGYTGIINCNVSGQTGTIRAQAFRTASPETPIAEKIISIVNNLFKSTTGLFIVSMSFIFFTFVGIFSPIMAIVFGTVGLLIGVAFGVFHYGLVIAIAVLGGIIINFMRNK